MNKFKCPNCGNNEVLIKKHTTRSNRHNSQHSRQEHMTIILCRRCKKYSHTPVYTTTQDLYTSYGGYL